MDHAYAVQTEFGRPLVDSTFTLALVTGQSVTDVSQNVMATLAWDEIKLPGPGIRRRYDLLPLGGIGEARVEVAAQHGDCDGGDDRHNQDGETVITFKRTVMVYKRPHVPKIARPSSKGMDAAKRLR